MRADQHHGQKQFLEIGMLLDEPAAGMTDAETAELFRSLPAVIR
ncbi:hypothetical protein OB934_22790 [Aeromonas salmonicida]|nr:hypothetical protein [Aeromonas salmonicida]MDM5065584.1 hypothetical protein [Aeromonas salmonicida]